MCNHTPTGTRPREQTFIHTDKRMHTYADFLTHQNTDLHIQQLTFV